MAIKATELLPHEGESERETHIVELERMEAILNRDLKEIEHVVLK